MLSSIEFTEEEEHRFEEMLRLEREETVSKIYAKIDKVYDERMKHFKTLKESNPVNFENFTAGFVLDPQSGKEVYQYFDNDLGIIRLLTVD